MSVRSMASMISTMDEPVKADAQFSQLEEMLKTLQKPDEKFYAQLKDFPHSFQLLNQECLQINKLKKTKRTLESALKTGYKTPLETARARNLLTYIYFQLGLHEEALNQQQQAQDLEAQHQNIVSIANKAVILWRLEQRKEAEELVRKLNYMKAELSEFSYLVVKARAELAFSYTRFDSSFYPLAEALFNKVIPEAAEPEVWLWKFGLGLTQRRLLRPLIKEESNDQENYLNVLRLFLDIVKGCQSDSLKAKVYAEIALLLYMPRSEDCRQILQKQSGMTVSEACGLALELDDNDNSVLWKCGKLYRYLRKTEESRDLLDKAVAKRPTSTGYHHLGLTYKALTTQEKMKKSKEQQLQSEMTDKSKRNSTSTGAFQLFMTQLSTSINNESHCNTDPTESAKQSSISEQDKNLMEENASADTIKKTTNCPSIAANESAHQTVEKSTKEAFEFWKIVKSPRGGTMPFETGDLYLKETIESLSRAVEISEWENTAAIYDLALMYKGMRDFERAKYYLEKLLLKKSPMLAFQKINIFEQLGLILQDMAQLNSNEKDSQKLTENSQSMLLMALKTASESYSKVPTDKHYIGDIWHSFHALLEAVDKNEEQQVRKLHGKATLFRLIKNNRKSLAILQDIEKMDPQKANDPEHLKLCIENYVEMQQYEDALTFVDLLQCTSQSQNAMQLFEDERFLHKIYMQAAKRSLQRGSLTFKSHFRSVFNEVIPPDTCTSSEDTDTDEGQVAKPTWDVLILYEETKEAPDLARGLASILTDICGLRITCMDDDVMGGFHIQGVLDIMRRCKMVVVMVGPQTLSRNLELFINHAVLRPTTVTVLVNGGHVPELMKVQRTMALPRELYVTSPPLDCEVFAQQNVVAVCDFFGFLVDIEFDQR